jgi:hypothetical protein
MAQKVVQYQAVLQLAQSAPQLYNLPLLHRQMIEVLGVKNASKLVPVEDDAAPTDPVQENQNVLTGKPVKAFMEQNHRAHLAVHTAALQDPKIMQIIGQNPQAAKIMGGITAHIAEHVGFQMRQKIEQQLGMPLPPEGEKLPPQIEIALSGMMAQAAQQVLQQEKAKQAQQQAQQQAQDPLIQMQQQELQLKAQELEMKKHKIALDAAATADKQDLEEQKVMMRDRKALHALLDQERGHASGTKFRFCLGIDDQRVRIRPIGDPHLGAVEQVVAAPLVAYELGFQLHADHIRARTRFTHRQRPHVLAGD